MSSDLLGEPPAPPGSCQRVVKLHPWDECPGQLSGVHGAPGVWGREGGPASSRCPLRRLSSCAVGCREPSAFLWLGHQLSRELPLSSSLWKTWAMAACWLVVASLATDSCARKWLC